MISVNNLDSFLEGLAICGALTSEVARKVFSPARFGLPEQTTRPLNEFIGL